MKIIESAQNPLIKQISLLHQKKHRQQEGLILLEGEHAIEEALKAGLTLQFFFQRSDASISLEVPSIIHYYHVSPKLMRKLATTESAPTCIAVVAQPQVELMALPNTEHALYVVLDQLQDPGNVGTIIRSAIAFGVDAILLTPGSVDPFSPKVIRSSAGLVLTKPVVNLTQPTLEVIQFLQARQFQVLTTSSHPSEKTKSYRAIQYAKRCALVFGNEGAGLSDSTANLADQALMIPTVSQVESLNVAISASIILAEVANQRVGHQS